MAEESEKEQRASEFLIAEYQEIYQEFRRLKDEGLGRLNFFITLTSSIVAGLVFLGQIGSISTGTLQIIAIGALIFLIVIGWQTFYFSVRRDVNTDVNLRAISRIRRYFVDQNPAIKPHLTWGDHDEPTPWITNNHSVIIRTTRIILGLLCGLLVGLILNLTIDLLTLSVISGLIGLVIVLWWLRKYEHKHFERATEIAKSSVRFPREEKDQETITQTEQ